MTDTAGIEAAGTQTAGAMDEPIAIVGMSCRFAPDLDTPGKLWNHLITGGGGVSDMPAKRWDPYTSAGPEATAILRRTTRKGAFLDDIEGFDAEFFQITPREAEFLDPQQRILLELSWEALGDAGVPPLSLGGSETGVYMSANSNDYGRRLLEDISRTGAWAVNGTTYYGIANRVSYFLDLRGHSMAVDTACAGSLTALHVACQSLRLGEAPLAIVGGINIMATPALVVALDAAGATSPDGRSKAFDKSADGYGRGEGAAVMILKRLSDARRDGDRVRALIVGSGVFQDGRSDGMMAPNSKAQEHMMRRILDRTGIDAATIDYVEAHGTGTPLGDVAEATAIGRVYGQGRTSGAPLLFGTLKPNIGHVEAASGIAGAMKVVLALENAQIPPSPHEEVNPGLDLDRSGMRLVAASTDWRRNGRPRRAAVSSYGVGGTIAHLLLEEAPADLATPRPADGDLAGAGLADNEEGSDAQDAARVHPLSANSESGLRTLAAGLAGWLRANPGAPLESVAHTLTRRRSHLPYRGAAVAATHEELTGLLDVLADGGRAPRLITGKAATNVPGAVWVFSGHGAQWDGMGRDLLDTEPAFTATIDALGPVFELEMGWTPRQVIADGGAWTVSKVQAMTFAMQAAFAQTWHAHGLRPAAVIGHSVGEIAAAVVAGCLDLEDAARFACRRAAALESVAGLGAMAMVGLPFREVETRLAGRADVVPAISAGARSTVVSGDVEAVEEFARTLEGEGIEVRRVNTDVAFHSPHVDPVLPPVAAAAAELTARPAGLPLYSTALDAPRDEDLRHGAYWERNLRRPVRFAEAIHAALEDGARHFLEISSHPVVTHSITETVAEAGFEGVTVAATLRRDQPGLPALLTNLARLHAAGVEVGWTYDGTLLSLPSAGWQHRPYWIFPTTASDSGGRGHDPDTHTLLGGLSTVAGAPAQRVWQTHLDMSNRPYHQDHKVVGVETVPASVVINSFVQAAQRAGETTGLTDIVLRTPLAALPPRVVQIVLEQNQIRLASRIRRDDDDAAGQDTEWITHATATVDRAAIVGTRPMEDFDTIRARCPDVWTWERVDEIFVNMGVEGYTFPWVVEELRRGDDEQFAAIMIDHTPKLHPSSWTAVIDGALTVAGVLVTSIDSTQLRTSSDLDAIAFEGPPPGRIYVHATRSPASPGTSVDVLVADETGTVVCEAKGLKFTLVHDRPGAVLPPRELVHEIVWEPLDLAAAPTAVEHVYLLGDPAETGPLADAISAHGVPAQALAHLQDLTAVPGGRRAALIVTPARLLPGEDPEHAAGRCAWTLLEALQHLSAHELTTVKLWTLTRGVRTPVTEAALAHAPLWGVSRIIAGERPDLWGGILDLTEDGEVGPGLLLDLLTCIEPTEDVVSIDPEGVHAARLTQVERQADGEPLECRPNGTYLITGGLGALGLEVARYLVDHGARRLVLAGRRGLPPRTAWDTVTDPATRARIDAVTALEALGAHVRVLSLDISDHAAVAAALSPSALEMPPIRGIVHAAGVVSDALADNTRPEGLHTTLGPKAGGAMVLHRLFPPGTLDFFTMFSSCGQLARLTGQASYAAANSFLDGLAGLRHADGHTDTVSIGWTQWKGAGMGESTAGTTILEAEARGLGGISITEAFRAWAFSDRFTLPYYGILRVLPERSLPIFSRLVSVSDADGGPGAADTIDWAAVPDGGLDAAVLADVHEQVAAELNLATGDIDIDRPLIELGVDSVLTVGLRVRLNRRIGIDLPPTVLWSNPTVRALAAFLAGELRELHGGTTEGTGEETGDDARNGAGNGAGPGAQAVVRAAEEAGAVVA